MKIVYFSPYYFPYISGITTYPLHVVRELAKKHEVTVLTFKHSPTLASNETKDGVKIVRMDYNFSISKGFISFISLWYFWKHAKQADRIILNLPNVEGVPFGLFGLLFRKQIIAVYHCRVFFEGSFFAWLITSIVALAVHIQLTLASKVIVYTKDYAESTGVLPRYRNKVIEVYPPVPNYEVDINMQKKLLDQKKKAYWIGFAGRTAREKGLEYVIEATSILSKKNPDVSFAVVCAGPYGSDVAGESNYFADIQKLVHKSNVSVTFLGTLFSEQLMAFYQTIDVLVLPSINQTEAFGMVQIEAIENKTPVIASNLPGVRVPVTTTGFGLLCKPKNAVDLAQKIETLRKNPPVYDRLKISPFLFKNTIQTICSEIENLPV